MKYLCVENRNEVVPEAFLLMGASTKRAESGKIGMFGSGFKMAIAVLLRDNIPLIVVSGGVRYKFGVEPVTFRHQVFDRITVQEGRKKAEPTQMTTAMAMQWIPANALREIVSNAYDEENPEVFVSGELLDRPGYTRVYVQMTEAVYDIYRQFDRYFTFRRAPIMKGDGWAIFKPFGPGARVYRRGVQVFEDLDLPACFDYQSDELSVREDRTSERYECERTCAWIMNELSIEQHGAIMDFLCAAEGETFEGNNPHLTWNREEMMGSFSTLLNGRVAVTGDELEQYSAELSGHSTAVFPSRWVDAFKRYKNLRTLRDVISAPRLNGHTIVDVPAAERIRLDAAVGYCAAVGVPIDTSKLHVFETASTCAPLGYAVADTGEIMVNRNILDRGVREIVKVLFEEYVHVLSQNPDYTRGFQHGLIDQWLVCLERFAPVTEQALASRAA